MRTLKRFIVWLTETVCEAVLLLVLAVLVVAGKLSVDGLRISLFGVFIYFVGSGYIVTTSIIATLFRSDIPWAYPAVAAMLFVIQVQYFVEESMPYGSQALIMLCAAAIVFACSFVGGKVLRRWLTDK